jgi:hypothetical protein
LEHIQQLTTQNSQLQSSLEFAEEKLISNSNRIMTVKEEKNEIEQKLNINERRLQETIKQKQNQLEQLNITVLTLIQFNSNSNQPTSSSTSTSTSSASSLNIDNSLQITINQISTQMNTLTSEIEQLKNDRLCIICCEHERNILFSCSHSVLCEQCTHEFFQTTQPSGRAKRTFKCPICSSQIKENQTKKIFFS